MSEKIWKIVILSLVAIAFFGLPFSMIAFGSDYSTRQSPLYPYRNSIFLQDDFIGGTNTTGNIGQLGWSISAGTMALTASSTDHFGVYRMDTTAVINTLARVFMTLPTFTPMNVPHNEIYVIRLNQVDANTTARFGDSDGFGANPPTNGIYFERLTTDTNWFGVTRSGGTQTRVDTGVAADTNFHTFQFNVSSANVDFLVDNTLTGSSTTNIPTVGALMGFFLTNTAAASKTMDIDYFQIIFSGMNR